MPDPQQTQAPSDWDAAKVLRAPSQSDWDAAKPPPAKAEAPSFGEIAHVALKSYLDRLDPVDQAALAAGKGAVVDTISGLAHAIAHPLDTLAGMTQAGKDEYSKAKDAYQKGDYATATGHLLGSIPVVGPAVAGPVEKIANAKSPSEVFEGAGQLGVMAVPMGATGELAAGARGTMAAALEKAGVSRMTENLARAGTSKAALKSAAAAEDVAPRVAQETAAHTPEGLDAQIAGKFEDAKAALDSASEKRIGGGRVPTAPVVRELEGELSKMSAQPVEGNLPTRTAVTKQSPILDAQGKPLETTTLQAQPIGQAVISAPASPRAAVLQQAIAEIKQLGPVATYDALKKIRADYDTLADYKPSIAADATMNQAAKMKANGAADVTGTLRRTLAGESPETAAANADYSFWRNVSDLRDTKNELDAARARTGGVTRPGGLETLATAGGAIVGASLDGGLGAGLGAVLGPMALAIAKKASPAVKISSGRLMTVASQALKAGKVAEAQAALTQAARIAGVLDQFPQVSMALMPATATTGPKR